MAAEYCVLLHGSRVEYLAKKAEVFVNHVVLRSTTK